ncbi:bifunctional phosphoribosyl-AMP cyclohydrolase/phosphoribosyl-ATP diphosphatase HisIE [Brevibacillus sp. M2.1A]|uniref:bifunctional phosphoribosyl-AMP cyclohydrolase/phosphoribosyl-ATP diphosphatase HisIE n=1 Tax=Brevibacillus sp. M2.1A TaxID=2738980 RepID=UPI00156AD1A0|nr:bifunctional phosphoribosyl-AMP cyclohydrolase/phosphoribosyl-ATP diphosphatase HisIE [Brevibacillus sp. M2.1A]MCC8438616.1 bifunctional phosphoribosyl-AMP cyclohydrolase/phosphoribosyl-ATP diphosphatase HisIE [Brevibacillus sp. M2.1A]
MTGAGAFAVDKLRFDEKGLIPVIVQDAGSKTVLTLAYMNEESLQKSLATKETWFWSRSRQQLWHKGETSGHTQRIVSMRYDCDGDALVVMVEPNGPACHTGAYSCFSQEVLTETDDESVQEDRFAILSELEELIAAREAERPEGSYTTYLFEKGVDKILKKVGEEAAEVIIAAKNRSREELRYEASDLIFHLMVLLREQKLPLGEVLTELQRRR